MSKRAEMRRQSKEMEKCTKLNLHTYSRLLTDEQIEKIKEDARLEGMDAAFKLMLSIPVDVLKEYNWIKSADKKIPIFIDRCLTKYNDIKHNKDEFCTLIKNAEKLGQFSIIDK